MHTHKKKNWLWKFLEAIEEIGFAATVSLVFGLVMIIIIDFQEDKLSFLLGFVALVFGMLRFHAYYDTKKIIKEIRNGR